MGEKLKEALATEDEEKASQLREEMWASVYKTHKAHYAHADLWNDLAPRAGEVG